MKKRIISLLLAIVMVLGMAPMAVMAEEAVVDEVVCDHAATTETITPNGDGTHTVKDVCDECGEAVLVLDEPTKIDIDLEGVIAAAAAEGMFDAMTLTADGKAVDIYTNKAALADFNSWTQENYGWQIATTSSAYTYGASYVKTFIGIGEDLNWAIAHSHVYWNANRNWMDITFDVAEAGWYQFAVDSFQQAASNVKDETTGCNGGGNGNLSFKVNGDAVRDIYSFKSGGGKVYDRSLGLVYLNEGANTVSIFAPAVAENRCGFLNGYSFTKLEATIEEGTSADIDLAAYNAFDDAAEYTYEADGASVDGSVLTVSEEGTVSVTATAGETVKSYTVDVFEKSVEMVYDCETGDDAICDICGYDTTCYHEDLTVKAIDMKAMVKEAAKQDFWAALPTVALLNNKVVKEGVEVKAIGPVYGKSLSETELAAVKAFFAWVEANYDWSFNNDLSLFTSNVGNRLFLCADDSIAWGVDHWCYYINHATQQYRDSMYIDFDAPVAGTYRLDMTALLTNTTADYVDGTASGGGQVDIFVNDVLVIDNFTFKGANVEQDVTIATVLLKEGKNTIQFKTVDDINGANASAGSAYLTRTNVTINALSATLAEAVYNGDGTHTVGAICADCGEEFVAEFVENCTDANDDNICDICGNDSTCYHTEYDLGVDFQAAVKAFAEAQPEQWALIPNAVEGVDTTKVFDAAVAASDEVKAAYAAFNAFMAEEYGVCVASDIYGTSHGRLYLNTNEKAAWGFAFYPSMLAWSNGSESSDNRLNLTVTADEAGYYKLDLGMVQHTAGNGSASKIGALTGAGSGCGTVDVYVDSKLVIDDYQVNAADYLEDTLALGTVYLTEGDHTVSVHVITDNNGTAYNAGGRRMAVMTGLDIVAFDAIAGENFTHTISATCECGEALAESFTEDCADENADDACDICGNSMTCAHKDIDKTAIDFKAMAKEAAKQDFWAALPTYATSKGYEVKGIGSVYQQNMTEEQKAAAEAFFAWLKANYDWSIDGVASIFMGNTANRLFICADDNVEWGINHWNYFVGHSDKRDTLVMNVNVDEAGIYQLDMTAVLNSTASDYVVDTGIAAGGAYADLYVNGELVAEDVFFGAKAGTTVSEATLAAVALKAGKNVVEFETVSDVGASTASYGSRTNVALVGIAATKADITVNGDGTHTYGLTCSACGETIIASATKACVIPEGETVCVICGYDSTCFHADIVNDVNFQAAVKAFAKAQPEQWALIPNAVEGVDTTKVFDAAVAASDETKAAYAAFNAFMAEEYGVSVASDIYATSHGRLYLNANEKAGWGFAFYPSMLAWSNGGEAGDNRLNMTVTADEAGYYKLDLGMVQHTAGNGSAGKIGTLTGAGSGCGIIDVYVDSKLVIDDYQVNAADYLEDTLALGTVFLTEGDHTVSVHVITDLNGTAYNAGGRRMAVMTGLTVSTLEAVSNENRTHTVSAICECGETIVAAFTEDCVDADADSICDVCGYDLTCAHDAVTVGIDFKALAKAMAEEDFWATMSAIDDDTKFIGVHTYQQKLTEEEKAAYDAVLAYIAENTDFAISADSSLTNQWAASQLYFDATDDAQWGIAWYPGGFDTPSKDTLAFDVTVAEAGWYELDLDAVKTGSYNNELALGGKAMGGAYVDIYVNGALSVEDYSFAHSVGAALRVEEKAAVVYLAEGTNTISLRASMSFNKENTSGRRWVTLAGMELTKLDIVNNGDGTHTVSCVCGICDADVAETVTENCFDNNYNAKCDVCDADVALSTFEIADEADLIAFASYVNAGASSMPAVLTADIQLTGKWINGSLQDLNNGKLLINNAIGTAEAPYSGTFDGQGHTISGLFIDYKNHSGLASGGNELTAEVNLGLFGYVSGAIIKNVTVEGKIALSGRQGSALAIGGVVAKAYDLTISDVISRVSMTGNGNYQWGGFSNVGGIVGYAKSVNMTRCGNEGDQHIMGMGQGGLVGVIAISDAQTVISDSYNTGKIEGNQKVGGLIGILNGCTLQATPTTIKNCYSVAEVNAYRVDNNDISVELYNYTYHGGMIGYVDGQADTDTYLHVENAYVVYETICPATSTVDQNTAIVGGAAAADGLIPTPYATGTYENIYYASESRTSPNGYGTKMTVEQMKDASFAATMGDAFKAAADGRTAILAWQDDSCAHEYTANEIICNNNGTHTIAVICGSCNATVSSTDADCEDVNEDDICDVCDGKMACEHANTTVSFIDNGDGTHTKSVTCTACGEPTETEVTEACADEDADGFCDACDAVVETVCDHTKTSSETVSNGDKTHTTTVTCECGEVISTETADCTDADKDCDCDVCGATIKTIKKAVFAGSNMTLGNELEVNFLMVKKNLPAGDYTATITQKMADGTERVTEIAMAQWGTMGSYHKISARIAAREMADDLYIEIRDAEGYVYNEEYFTSVRGYAGRALAASSTTQFVRIMMIDMLNYGAAAQNHFKYNVADLANNELTEEQQALATAKVTCTNNQVKDKTVYGANLSLEDSILLNTFFKGLKSKDVTTMYAMVNFTDFEGKVKEVRMEGTEFEKYGSSGDIYKIVVDDVVLADAKTLVTVTLYNADGSVFGAGSDSVESYVARAESNNADTYGLYANIMKFATSAYNYIINK